MPRLDADSTMTSQTIGGSTFTYQAARIGDLGATEYTLATIAIDVTSSVSDFADQLRQMLVAAIQACARDPRSDNLLVRVLLFSTSVGVQELHGFKPLSEIDANDYPQLRPGGMTPLYDATYSAIGAAIDYGKQLMDQDFLANAITYIVTDGGDNASTTTAAMVRRLSEEALQQEKLESHLSVLVGINTDQCGVYLDRFRREGGISQYIPAGDATPATLAKLGGHISQSISSQSQALGTGGPSRAVSATI